MTGILQIIFWLSTAAIFYTFIGYPIFVYLVSLIFPLRIKKSSFDSSVTILITAYNEDKDIREKLENTLAIDFPPEKLEIIVASDGSTDRTDEIVREFEDRGVRLYRQEGRAGKTVTQNNAVAIAKGDIILFSDATAMYQPDVLKKILPNFNDESVGCVAGKLIYVDSSKSGVGKGAKSYWNYETFLKENESRACSLIGASGCLYAVRRSAYKPMYPEACSDFLIASILYEQDLRTVYEPEAICVEQTNRRTDKEMTMRVRVISQTFTDLWRYRKMMNPFRSGFFAVELVSHKLFRYSVPIFLILLYLSSFALAFRSEFFEFVLLVQTFFYILALVAWLLEKSGKSFRLLAIPLYFVLTNAASLIGFYKFLRGERYAKWEPIRESKENVEQPT